jgi:lipopolysaccharide assembly protein A
MQFLRTLFWVMIAAFLAIVASENWRDVTLDLWGNLQADIKIPVLLFLVFLLGFLPTWLVMRSKLWRLQRRLTQEDQAKAVPPPPPAPATAPSEDGL